MRDLEGLRGASLPEKIDELLRMRDFRERAERMRRALEDEHPDLSELVQRMQDPEARGETWVFDTNAVAKAKSELEEINRRINEGAEESGSLITDGRYSRLFALEDGSPGLLVKGNYVDHPVEAGRDYLSRGTPEQVYLALRLALVDHLDAEDERLPLLLDEACGLTGTASGSTTGWGS